MNKHPPPSERFPELDWMRGVAALAVVGFHYLYKGPKEGWMHVTEMPFLADLARYGYLGVHLFFMISGYVILLTAQHATLRGFLASRVSRLAPALWVCVLLTALIEWLIPASPFQPEGWGQILANLTLFPGLFGHQAIDGAYWSLAVELTFYFWVGVCVALGQMHRIELLIKILLLLSLVNIVRPAYPLQLYLCVQWAPLFSAGAIFFLAKQSGWNTSRRWMISVCVVLASVYAWREAGPITQMADVASFNQGANRLVVVAIVMVFFALFLWITRGNNGRPTAGSDLAGRLTYPLYLIHQNAGYALFNLAASTALVTLVGQTAVISVLIILAIAAAWGIHSVAERPIATWLRLSLNRKAVRQAAR